jgi:cathepsin L
MKLVLSLLVLSLGLNVAYALNDLFKLHLWDKFKKTHAKEYFSVEHETFRFDIFKQHLDLIEKHNEEYSMGLHSYTLGVNAFADWTFKEFREIMFGTRRNLTSYKSSGTFVRLPKHIQVPLTTPNSASL